MKEDFARMKCPACGAETFVRVNKNRILYTYCPMGHHLKLTAQESRQAIPALAGGKPWNNGLIYLYPMNGKGMDNDSGKQRDDAGRRDNDTNTGAEYIGSNGSNTRNGDVHGWWDV